ncbi:MAG TPA: hypothetical protein VNA20_19015 [Frankiaceae bacterium]|nr:hypothetical protein [Frankiaceae bacterium]
MGALALNAPVAQADVPHSNCHLRSVQQDSVTGQSFQGVLVGGIAHADPTEVSIRCWITVNGVLQTGADTGAPTTANGSKGTAVAVAQKDVSFTAGDTDVVRICYTYTSAHGNGNGCTTVGIIQVPPQVVYDTIDGALEQVWPIIDPPICSVLKQLAGTYGAPPVVIVITSEGDIYVNGELVWDCPPYVPET